MKTRRALQIALLMLATVVASFALSPVWSVTVSNPGQMASDSTLLWVLSGPSVVLVNMATHTVYTTITPGALGTPLSTIIYDGAFMDIGDYDGQLYRINDATLSVYNVAAIPFAISSIAFDGIKRELWVGTNVSYDGNHYFMYVGALAVPSMSWSHIISTSYAARTSVYATLPTSNPAVVTFGQCCDDIGEYESVWRTNTYSLESVHLVGGGFNSSIPAWDAGLGAAWMGNSDYLFGYLVSNYYPGPAYPLCAGPNECDFTQVVHVGHYLFMASPGNNEIQVVDENTFHIPTGLITGLPATVTWLNYNNTYNILFAGSPASNVVTALQ